MIKLEHVSKSYSAGIPALNDVSLNIEEGEFVFVVGDSGSGKSTLIKLLLKELEPTEGTITINGRKLNKIRRRQIPKFRRNIGVVFQDFRLLKDRNIYDNVAFAQKVIGESNRSIKKNVPKLLSMVGLAAKYRSYPRQLSGGEQQRVAIARALINKPKILLADEPTSALDVSVQAQVLNLLQELKEIYASGDTKQGLEINVMAFGFKYGMPLDADLVFDVRCFPNPFYIDELKHKTGNDKEVQDYVMSFPKSVTFMEKLEDFMKFMIPLYIEEGKISLTIAIGCTGGKHRSVTMSNKLADYLKSCDYTVNVSYRDMGRE